MDSKIFGYCAVLCILSYCSGDNNTTLGLSSEDIGTSNETLRSSELDSSNESNDLIKDASIWRFWNRLRNLGFPAYSTKLTRFPFKKESERGGRYGLHRDRPKIKNKIKLLFKLKQFEV